MQLENNNLLHNIQWFPDLKDEIKFCKEPFLALNNHIIKLKYVINYG